MLTVDRRLFDSGIVILGVSEGTFSMVAMINNVVHVLGMELCAILALSLGFNPCGHRPKGRYQRYEGA